MEKIKVVVCFLQLVLCYGLTEDISQLETIPKFENSLDVSKSWAGSFSEILLPSDSSQIDIFKNRHFKKSNTPTSLSAVSKQFQKHSLYKREVSTQDTTIYTTLDTSTISLDYLTEQSNLAECGKVSNYMGFEILQEKKFHLTWEYQGNNSNYLCVFLEVVNGTNLENCSKEDCDILPNLGKHNFYNLCPFQNYNISLQLQCSSSLGNPVSFIYRTEPGVPGAPKNLKAIEVNATSLTVKWDLPERPNGDVNKYSLKYLDKILDTNSSLTQYVIRDLQPFSYYNISVCAWTTAGQGPWSSLLTVRTDVNSPAKLENVTVLSVSPWALYITWNEPSIKNGPIDGYVVQWSTNNSSVKKRIVSSDIRNLTLLELKPGTHYIIQLSAYNINLQKKRFISEAVLADSVTEEYFPSRPVNVSILNITDTSLRLKWKKPEEPNGEILFYTVFCNSSNEVIEHLQNETDILETTIKNLKPFTIYSCFVAAFTSAGQGPWSVEVTEKTDVGVPSSPMNVSILAFTNTSLRLEWRTPEEPNGEILFYVVFCNSSNEVIQYVQNETNLLEATIENLKPFTLYSCFVSASTSAGEGSWSLEITTKTDVGVPSTPKNLTIQEKYDSYLLVVWSSPELSNGPINGYQVFWWENGKAESGLKQDVDQKHCYLSYLKPWTNYTVQVSAYNVDAASNILSGPATILNVRTSSKIPKPSVIILTTVLSSKSVQLEWENQDEIFPGPTNRTVEVWENLECTGEVRRLVQKYNLELASWNISKAVVQHLKPHTLYQFRIASFTDAGGSLSNFSMTVKTASDIPGPPQNFRVNCFESSTFVTLKWNSPKEKNGDITEYCIEYRAEINEVPNTKIVTTEPETACERIEHSTKLVNLRPEMNYRFGIKAKTLGVNSYGPITRYQKKCILPAGVPPIPKNSSNLAVRKAGQEEVNISWSREIFSSRMGRIVQYSVIVATAERIGLPNTGNLSRAGRLPTWAEFWKNNTDSYQSTPIQWNPFIENIYDPLNCHRFPDTEEEFLQCTIGWEKNCTTDLKEYCNGPLKPGKQYGLKLRGFTLGGFSETYPLFFATAPPEGRSSILLPVCLAVSLLFIAFGFGLYYFFFKKKLRPPVLNEIMVFFRKPSFRSTEPPVPVSSMTNGVIQSEAKYPRPMNFTTFLEHIKIMTSDSDLKFSLEYEELKQNSPRHPCTAAAMEENRPKNRWMNIFPFDHSRVKLLPIDDEPGSDYINASYIPGFSSHREYIASQGPLPQTLDDFWRMVWEQKVSIIVMLTQCIERGKTKCEQYWPTDEEYKYYGDLKVQTKSVSVLPEYTIRYFDLSLGTRERTVTQMHFTRWPDFGCPEVPAELINFVKAVRAHLSHTNNGPILVHCSAGVGRTGTFIAVDRLMQYMEYHNCVDIYGTVMDMREHRINMVQTENQYIYIHQCVKELILEKLKIRSSNEHLEDGFHCNINLKKNIE